MKIKLNLDSQRLQAKPKVFDGRLRNRLCNAASITEVTPEELMAAIQEGRTFTPAVMTGTTGDTWQEQQVICADIDNDSGKKDTDGNKIRIENPITPDRAADIMREYGIDPFFMYYSFSNAEGWPKFRIVLILDAPLTDPAETRDLEARFTGIFNRAELRSADTTNSDSARLYYGGRSGSVFYCSGQKTAAALLQALPEPPEKPIEEPKRPKTATKPKPAQKITPAARNAGKRTFDELQAQLRADIEAFDLAEYVQETTASRPVKRGRSLFFNPCPICGHNDDFQVTGSLYHCHSASGGTGGTIIDYLMNREEIGRAEALEKFKFEIMRYDRDEWRRAYREMKKEEEEAARRAPFAGPDPEAYEMTEEEIQAALDAEAAEYEEYLQTPEGQAEAAETAEYWTEQTTGGADPGEQQQQTPPETPPERSKTPAEILQDFRKTITSRKYEPIKTGIPAVDRMFGGGLIRGTLVTLQAAPGMGKTTLAQWIFENMAAAGNDVLYINLEMDREQLLARSIARIAWRNYSADFDALEILRAYQFENDTIARDVIDRSIEDYTETTAPRLTYNPEALQNKDGTQSNHIDRIMDAIQKEADRVEKAGRPTPIICIDYLQIIKTDQRDTAEGVKEVMHRLKDFAARPGHQTTVFLITAQNRAANSQGEAEQESGRDTSDIEYTADIMLAITYTAIEDHEKYTVEDTNGKPKSIEYTLKEIRKLAKQAYTTGRDLPEVCKRYTLKVNKHRFAAPGKNVKLIFDGRHSMFETVTTYARNQEGPTSGAKRVGMKKK